MKGKAGRGLLLALALAGCVAAPVAPPEQAVFRTAGAPFASSTRFDAARMAGDWRLVAAFSGRVGRLPPVGLRLAAVSGGIEVARGGWVWPEGRYGVTGPGRLVRDGGPEVWVIWVDDDFRTAVLGSPDGRLGFILDRGRISADRLRAAREILAWQGYDMTQLREVAE
jgi:apolipoprotein D and lipocalin family protein